MGTILISGFYGFDNSGDEAILHSMVSELNTKCPEAKITVLSADPERTERLHGVKAVNRSNFYKVCSAIWNCDVLISGGGSLFQDVTSNYSMWYYSSIILFAFLLKKPVFAFAQGIGPISNRINNRLLRYIMNRVRSISVRDERSRKELEQLGVKKEIRCMVDPAFSISPCSAVDSLKLLEQENRGVLPDRPRIGFSIRTWKNNTDVVNVMAKVGDRAARELNAQVVFFPLHYKKDLELAERIAVVMKEKALVVRGQYAPVELIGLYGLMDINVSIRFHGLVFSIINSVPVVAVSYDPKIDSLMDLVGVSNYMQYDTLDADLVFEAIRSQMAEREKLSGYIGERVKSFRKTAQNGLSELIEAIRMELRSKN